MDQVGPFFISLFKKANENRQMLVTIGVAILVVCCLWIIFFKTDPSEEEQIKKKDCPKIKNCNSYSSSLCFLVIVFIYLVATKKITINTPAMAVLNKGLPPMPEASVPAPASIIPTN